MELILGIDPGAKGAIAALKKDGSFHVVHDIPTETVLINQTNRLRIDHIKTYNVLEFLSQKAQKCVLEKVSPRPTDGPEQAFYFGESYGILKTMVKILHIPLIEVSPLKWKNRIIGMERKGDLKELSLREARCLWPTAPLDLKKHEGRAEALLIALYGIDPFRKKKGNSEGEVMVSMLRKNQKFIN